MADSERPPMTAANGDILWPRFTYDRMVYIHSHCLIHLTITGSSLTILAYMLYRLLHQQVSREVYRMVSTVCMWIQLIVCLWVASHELIKQNKQTNKKKTKRDPRLSWSVEGKKGKGKLRGSDSNRTIELSEHWIVSLSFPSRSESISAIRRRLIDIATGRHNGSNRRDQAKANKLAHSHSGQRSKPNGPGRHRRRRRRRRHRTMVVH